MSEDEHSLDGQKEAAAVVPTKSFSINSILSKQGDDDDKVEEEKKAEEDVPAVVSKLEFPAFPTLGKLPLFPRGGEAAGLSLGHLPTWYHWYASQQCFQQLQQKKSKLNHYHFLG